MIDLTENVKNEMLGLLPFDEETEDRFTPLQFLKKDKNGAFVISQEYHPVFILKPWTKKEKDSMTLLVSRIDVANSAEDRVRFTKTINEETRKKVLRIENLYDIGKQELIECPIDEKLNCISVEIWNKIPEIIKTALYFRLSTISGLTTNEKLGL